MENTVTTMHQMVNQLYAAGKRIKAVIDGLPKDARFDALRSSGKALLTEMTAWDNDMVQRKSKAYDDVENYPNKFTAGYMFLINQTESDLPRINQANKDQQALLNAEWSELNNRAKKIMQEDMPVYNEQLWQAGVGAIWTGSKS